MDAFEELPPVEQTVLLLFTSAPKNMVPALINLSEQ